MPLLYFDYLKTADFGSEKKILVQSTLVIVYLVIVESLDIVDRAV